MLFFAVLCTVRRTMARFIEHHCCFPTTTVFSPLVTEGVGTSGTVVDNCVNTTAPFRKLQASDFNASAGERYACNNTTNGGGTGGRAVKLTQAALQ